MTLLESAGAAGAPYFPDEAPFSAEQRVWLSGFLAGISTRIGAGASGGGDAASAGPSLHILYGSQTGNAEELAEQAAEQARAAGLSATVTELDQVEPAQLAEFPRVLVITSTYGEGEMPDNAEIFWDAVSADDAPRLDGKHFAVLALGDTSYDGYCQAGRLIDTRFEQLGAERVLARVDCDVDFEDAAAAWLAEAVPAFATLAGATAGGSGAAGAGTGASPGGSAPAKYTRKSPYASNLVVNRVLNSPESAKEVRHLEFDLTDSGLAYEAGDALGVIPVNDPVLAEAIATQLGDADDALAARLVHDFEISAPSKELLAAVAEREPNGELAALLSGDDKAGLENWLWGRDTLDLLRSTPGTWDAQSLSAVLKPLQHRAYSISSSPLADADRVHLTVAAVRYRRDDRDRGGVASTFLADRAAQGLEAFDGTIPPGDAGPFGSAGIFLSANKSFRVPADDTAPAIMVGPGTGIAPFRAFLQERKARGAAGRNWLFFGDQHRATDFLYEDELTALSDDGVLTRLDLAFSRDQAQKIYVQTRMRENGRDLFAWLEEGGHFYVCGDAGRMAKDVDDALHAIVRDHGGHDDEGAAEYIKNLKKDKRYLRDVY